MGIVIDFIHLRLKRVKSTLALYPSYRNVLRYLSILSRGVRMLDVRDEGSAFLLDRHIASGEGGKGKGKGEREKWGRTST